MPLLKKGRGPYIHVSGFKDEETGRLVVRNPEGGVLKQARKTIFPGAGADKWWDIEQLLVQVFIDGAYHSDFTDIHIHRFGNDALRDPEVNQSDGGTKENGQSKRPKRDTVFPDTCPDVHDRGQTQKMVTDGGVAKRLDDRALGALFTDVTDDALTSGRREVTMSMECGQSVNPLVRSRIQNATWLASGVMSRTSRTQPQR